MFDPSRIRLLLPATLTAAVLLGACGGGGEGGAPANQPPVAKAFLSGEAVLNVATLFDTAGSIDPEGKPVTRSWDYGDGQTGTADSHVYTSAATFTAVHTVTDDQGAKASQSVTLTVAKCSVAGRGASLASAYPSVCMQTSRGEIVIEVYPAQAPLTAANFLRYVDEGFYSGTLFHRVIPLFVVQAGGYTSGMVAKPATYPAIALESNNGLHNLRYTLAMARTSVPNSATTQFFVNLQDNLGLDFTLTVIGASGYAVFGKVISGTAVVDAIAAVATASVAGFADVPVQDVLIRSVTRLP